MNFPFFFKDVAKYINEYKRDMEAVKVLSQIENRFVQTASL